MKKINSILISSLFVATTSFANTNSGYVPMDWYTPAEKMTGFTAEQQSGDLGKLDSTLTRILNAQLKSLDSVNEQNFVTENPENLVGKPADWVPWRFVAYVTELALTASGGVGVLGLAGETYAKFYWNKKEGSKFVGVEESTGNLSALIDNSMTTTQVRSSMETLYRAALATGKIQNPEEFKKNFFSEAQRFQEYTYWMAQSDYTGPWWASRYREDLTIGASGKVYFGTMGGALRIRLQWHRVKTAKQTPPTTANIPNDIRVGDGIKNLLNAMAQDLQVLADDSTMQNPNFQIDKFRVGLGVSAKGDIGVIKGEGSLVGHVYFSRNIPKHLTYMPPVLKFDDRIPMNIVLDESDRSQNFVGAGDWIKKIERETFREGLKKAMKIGDFMGGVVGKVKNDKWGVKQMKLGFTVTLSGSIVVAEIGGIATTELEYQNVNY